MFELCQVPADAVLWHIGVAGESKLSFDKRNSSLTDGVSSPINNCCGGRVWQCSWNAQDYGIAWRKVHITTSAE